MFLPAFPEHVVRDIGTKTLGVLHRAVEGGRVDFDEYRRTHPAWAASNTNRFLCNFIHERTWEHLVDAVGDIEEVNLVDRMPTRDMHIGTRYRVRFKKHSPAGAVTSYPTPTALDFYAEPALMIPQLQQVNLTVGYEWDEELREMGRPVMALHSGMGKALWMIELPDAEGGSGTVGVLHAPIDGPTLPTIYVPGVADEETNDG